MQKSIVLDIAGGKGDFTWELVNLIGCPQSVLVDPRGPISTSRMDKLWYKGMFDPKRTGPIFSKWFPAVSLNDYQNKHPKQPKHIRCFFNAPSFLSVLQNESTKNNKHNTNNDDTYHEDWFQSERSRAKKIQWTTQGLQNDDTNNQLTTTNNKTTNNNSNNMMEVSTVKELKEILAQCGLIVGLHPDQATGDIVQFAEHLNIPWCIVPCWYVYFISFKSCSIA